MNVIIPIAANGDVGPHLGKARGVAVARVADGAIADWTEYDVAWDASHDVPGHHGRVMGFLTEHGITHAVVDHMGPGMVRNLQDVGVQIVNGARGNAREAVERVVAGASM